MLIKNRPFIVNTGFDKVFNDLAKLDFDKFFKDDFSTGHLPAVNVLETEDDYLLEVNAAGFSKEDFKINLENDTLTISAAVENNTGKTDKKYTRREFRKRSFKRAFHLPETVNTTAINAKYENGILTLSLPKKEEAKPIPAREIEIV